MKVRCKPNSVGGPDKKDIAYIVYAMLICKGSVKYLLAEEEDEPFWYPANIFEVVDSLLPIIWYFSFKGYDHYDSKDPDYAIYPVTVIWGYKEMIFDPEHRIDLIECEPEALEIFKKRKEEIDEYEELRAQK